MNSKEQRKTPEKSTFILTETTPIYVIEPQVSNDKKIISFSIDSYSEEVNSSEEYSGVDSTPLKINSPILSFCDLNSIIPENIEIYEATNKQKKLEKKMNVRFLEKHKSAIVYGIDNSVIKRVSIQNLEPKINK